MRHSRRRDTAQPRQPCLIDWRWREGVSCVKRINIPRICIAHIHRIKFLRKHGHRNIIRVVPIVVLIQDCVRHLKQHQQEKHYPAKLHKSWHLPESTKLSVIALPQRTPLPQRQRQHRYDNPSIYNHQHCKTLL